MNELLTVTVWPILNWMGGNYNDPRAAAMLLAIAQTESACIHRRQLRGPARSFWQIEPFTGLDFLQNRRFVMEMWTRLHLPPPSMTSVRTVLEWNDPIACVIARELLWHRLPQALPMLDPSAAEEACQQYLQAWRPGRPHPERFLAAWPRAVDLVGGGRA